MLRVQPPSSFPHFTKFNLSLSLVPPPQRFHAFFHNFTHYSLSVMIYAIVALLTYYILWLDGDLNATFKTFASKPRNLQPYFTTYTSRYHSSTFYNCQIVDNVNNCVFDLRIFSLKKKLSDVLDLQLVIDGNSYEF